MSDTTKTPGPLAGIRVVEFTHMVMGPTVGAILAELGATVVKVEPITGDATRELTGSGAGYFPMYNRGKQSVAINVKDPRGLGLVLRLVSEADVFVENFRSGAMEGLGLGSETLRRLNPWLVYCSEKGFLPGPYSHRTALDEVAQMMGGLAYMTGPPGRPLRAGSSVIDVTGGMFGVIGILAALEERHRTGLGRTVTSALFETTAYLVGQHMAQQAVTGKAPQPMPVRLSAWAIYDVFQTQDGEQVFVGIVSDTQWLRFCRDFRLETLGSAPEYASNRQRVAARDTLLPIVRDLFGGFTRAALIDRLERSGLPFAPIGRPEDLFTDPHLTASGGLQPVVLPDGSETRLPVLPIAWDDERLRASSRLPEIGEHTATVLTSLGLSETEIRALMRDGVVGGP